MKEGKHATTSTFNTHIHTNRFAPYLLEDPGVLQVVVHERGDLRHAFVVQARHASGLRGEAKRHKHEKKKTKRNETKRRIVCRVMLWVRRVFMAWCDEEVSGGSDPLRTAVQVVFW